MSLSLSSVCAVRLNMFPPPPEKVIQTSWWAFRKLNVDGTEKVHCLCLFPEICCCLTLCVCLVHVTLHVLLHRTSLCVTVYTLVSVLSRVSNSIFIQQTSMSSSPLWSLLSKGLAHLVTILHCLSEELGLEMEFTLRPLYFVIWTFVLNSNSTFRCRSRHFPVLLLSWK